MQILNILLAVAVASTTGFAYMIAGPDDFPKPPQGQEENCTLLPYDNEKICRSPTSPSTCD